jgi:hypothetical protein
VRGKWGGAGHLALGSGLSASGEVYYTSISCPDADDCTVGGRYGNAHANDVIVAGRREGSWGPVTVLPGLANHGGPAGIESVSCSAPGDCGAGGDYVTGDKGFVASSCARQRRRRPASRSPEASPPDGGQASAR